MMTRRNYTQWSDLQVSEITFALGTDRQGKPTITMLQLPGNTDVSFVNLPTGSYHLTRSEHISEVRMLERMWHQVKRLSQRAAYGTFVPFRHTYNASRII